MNIDRSNYEIWLIDWIDGNLDDFQVGLLKAFLKENPDLGEEFYETETVKLRPPGRQFTQKETLKKSGKDLSKSQFEYLCVASLENDLNPEQTAELLSVTELSPEKKKTYELIRKLKVHPQNITFSHKSGLHKRTARERIFYISAVGLSAAAAILLMVVTYTLIPRGLPGKLTNTAQNSGAGAGEQQSKPAASNIPAENSKSVNPSQKTKTNASQANNPAVQKNTITAPSPEDNLPENTGNPLPAPVKLDFIPEISVGEEINRNYLIASDFTVGIPAEPVDDDIRSKLSRFIAKTFRERILKENNTKDSPLKGYEIAEAGVSGLNKLFGWQMALEKNNDESGELKSVYFSSKLIKFKAPVHGN